jgi:hypothetical protein
MKSKDEKKIREIIKDELESYGIKKERIYGEKEMEIYGIPIFMEDEKISPFYEMNEKFNLLCKHLGLEYFKKEIKETNGEEKEYTQEGFRKIKTKK